MQKQKNLSVQGKKKSTLKHIKILIEFCGYRKKNITVCKKRYTFYKNKSP